MAIELVNVVYVAMVIAIAYGNFIALNNVVWES